MEHLPKPVAWGISAGLALVAKSLRLKVTDPEGFSLPPFERPALLAVWHNRIVLMPALAPPGLRRRMAFLASRSKDGGYIADVLNCYGMSVVRGSSSRGGAAAVREMRELLAAGKVVAITPDGPRGPRYEPRNGILYLAAETGVPIVPASLNVRCHYACKTWDQTQLPLPFAKGELVVGEEIHLAGDLSGEALAAARTRVREAMMAITRYDKPDRVPGFREKRKRRSQTG